MSFPDSINSIGSVEFETTLVYNVYNHAKYFNSGTVSVEQS